MAVNTQIVDEALQSKVDGTYTLFPVITSASDRIVDIQGHGPVIMLASCDYLGMSNDVRMKSAAKDAIDHFGTNVCGSIAFSGYTTIHRDLDLSIREFFGREDSIMFTTSYLANLGCLSTLFDSDDVLLCDRLNHVSLNQGAILSGARVRTYKHNDMNMLETALKKSLTAKKRAIVSDGLFSADGDYANIPAMVDLAQKYGALLIIDSAHDAGICGPNGRGVAEHFGMLDKVDLMIGTMSKSFGSTGGFVVGNKDIVTQVRFSGPYHSSRTVSPGVAAASLQALQIMREEGAERRQILNANTERFLEGVKKIGYDTLSTISAIVPICLKETSTTFKAASWLKSRGILVAAFVPPSTPRGWARLRFGVTSKLTESDIDTALRHLAELKSVLDDGYEEMKSVQEESLVELA